MWVVFHSRYKKWLSDNRDTNHGMALRDYTASDPRNAEQFKTQKEAQAVGNWNASGYAMRLDYAIRMKKLADEQREINKFV